MRRRTRRLSTSQTSFEGDCAAQARVQQEQRGADHVALAINIDPAPSDASDLELRMDRDLEENHAPEALHAGGDRREAATG